MAATKVRTKVRFHSFRGASTWVAPVCCRSAVTDRKMQLIVSRVPSDVAKSPHEWGFTVFCFFPSKQSPSWKYLVGTDGKIMTAGAEPLGLFQRLARSPARSAHLARARSPTAH